MFVNHNSTHFLDLKKPAFKKKKIWIQHLYNIQRIN